MSALRPSVVYTHTNTHTHKTIHTCAVTYSVVVFSINASFAVFLATKNSHDRLPRGYQCHSHVSLRVNADEQQGMKAEVHKRTLQYTL